MLIFGSKKIKVVAAVTGKIIDPKTIKDETFSQNMLGQTIAILPSSNGKIVAPISGQVVTVQKTGHAFCIRHKTGVNVLVHIGIDTVEINSEATEGKPLKAFEPKVSIGQGVKAGDEICQVDFNYIKKNNYDPTTMIVIMEEGLGDWKYSSTLINDDIVAGDQLGFIVK